MSGTVIEAVASALSIKLTGSDWLKNDYREAAEAAISALADNVSDEMVDAFYAVNEQRDTGEDWMARSRRALAAALRAPLPQTDQTP